MNRRALVFTTTETLTDLASDRLANYLREQFPAHEIVIIGGVSSVLEVELPDDEAAGMVLGW